MKHKHIDLTAAARTPSRRKLRRRGRATRRVAITSRHHRSETTADAAV